MAKSFKELSAREILALAISLEEEDGRTYGDFAEALRAEYPETAATLLRHAGGGIRPPPPPDRGLSGPLWGAHPLVHRRRREGLFKRKPVWLIQALSIAKVRREIAVDGTGDPALLRGGRKEHHGCGGAPAAGRIWPPRKHGTASWRWSWKRRIRLPARPSGRRRRRKRSFVLQMVQPGLVGLMDGSVSTLAPVFRRRLRHQEQPGRVPGRDRRLGRGGHQHGFRRGAFR